MKRKDNLDTLLIIVLFLILGFGVVMMYSTSAIYAEQVWGDLYYFLRRHLLWICMGLIGLWVTSRIDYSIYRRYSGLIFLVCLGLLLAVYFPGIGKLAGGARRWIRVGGVTFQPSEIMKLGLVIYLSDLLIRKKRYTQQFFKGLMPGLCVIGISAGPILLQPDLGTTVEICVIGFIILFVIGMRMRYLITLGLSVIPFLYVFIVSAPYRRARILTFLNPWADPEGKGFQVVQSFLALGSGGAFGVGLGHSRQKLFYLPAAHTDFIFSIIGEELGFIGATALVLLFLALLIIGIKIAMRAIDLYGHLLAVGIVSLIGLQIVVNIGVVTGVLPTKGLPLPFISFGGSAMICYLASIGILINVYRQSVYRQSTNSRFSRNDTVVGLAGRKVKLKRR